MVRGVARGVGVAQPPDRALVAEHPHALLGHGEHLAPQPVHLLAVQAARAVHEPAGVDQVPGAALVHPYLEAGKARGERARRAGVVEVDMGERQRPGLKAVELAEQGLERRGRAGVDEYVAHPPAADHPLASEVANVDRAELLAHCGAPGDTAPNPTIEP